MKEKLNFFRLSIEKSNVEQIFTKLLFFCDSNFWVFRQLFFSPREFVVELFRKRKN